MNETSRLVYNRQRLTFFYAHNISISYIGTILTVSSLQWFPLKSVPAIHISFVCLHTFLENKKQLQANKFVDLNINYTTDDRK